MKLFQFIPLVPAFLSLLVGATTNATQFIDGVEMCQDLAKNLSTDIFSGSCPPALVFQRINTISGCFQNITQLCPGTNTFQDASTVVVAIIVTFQIIVILCGVITVKIVLSGVVFAGLGPALVTLTTALVDFLNCVSGVLGLTAFAIVQATWAILAGVIAKLQIIC